MKIQVQIKNKMHIKTLIPYPKSNSMKKNLLIIFAAILMAMPAISFGQQETSTKENTEKACNISYSFINEYGFYGGGTFGFTGIFVNGIRFNKTQDLIGIGIGYELDFRSEQSLPIFFNYRHYFPGRGKKNLQPLVNIGIGMRISFWQQWTYWCDPWYNDYGGYWDSYCYSYSTQRVTPGLYATMAAGFKYKMLSFTSGFFMKSWNNEYFGGIEAKVGFTF